MTTLGCLPFYTLVHMLWLSPDELPLVAGVAEVVGDDALVVALVLLLHLEAKVVSEVTFQTRYMAKYCHNYRLFLEFDLFPHTTSQESCLCWWISVRVQ